MDEKKEQALFECDAKLSISEAIPMGSRHVVVAVVRIVTPGITTTKVCQLSPSGTTILIQASLIFSAVATLIQLFPIFGKVDSRLPVMMEAGFAYVPILMAIGAGFEIAAIFNSQLVGNILVIIVGLFIKKIRMLFPPLVVGTIILSIELSLFSAAIKYMAGRADSAGFGSARSWLAALLTFAIVFYPNYFTKGFLKLSTILNGVVIGYLISLALGIVSFEPAQNARIVQVIAPFHFGLDFQLVPIFTLVVIFIVDAVQAVGQFTAATVRAMDRDTTDEELSGGIMRSGFADFVGSLFGSIPVTTFGRSVGLVVVTKVISRYVLVFASIVLLVTGFVPEVATLLTTIPYAVVGGATISVFASISMIGIRVIAPREMTSRDTGVVGIVPAFEIGITLSTRSLAGFPTWVTAIFGNSEVILTTLIAVLLNVILKSKGHVALE